jgi:hypothetical protein
MSVDEGDETTRQRLTASAILSGAAALSALVVGILYTLGAVLVAGSLRDTGIPVRDALPLVPLPQLLGRGMSVLLSSLGIALMLLVSAVYLYAWGHWSDRLAERRSKSLSKLYADVKEVEEQIGTLPEEASHERDRLLVEMSSLRSMLGKSELTLRRVEKAAAALYAVAILPVMAFSDPVGAGFAGASLAFLSLGMLGVIRRRSAAPLALGALWLGVLLSAYYYPQQLPKVEVRTTGGIVRGTLITQTGAAFYVVVPKQRQFAAIPVAKVNRALISPAEPRGAPRLYSLVLP